MMMAKPAPTAPAPVASTAAAAEVVKKKASPEDAVKDLEKRLQMLETATTTTPAAAPTQQAAAPPPAAAAPAAAAKAGKNPLLARIMAAQERAKQPAAPAAAAPAPDLLDSFDAPAESESAPPPPFDVSLLPPQQTSAPPPPAFDASMLPPPAAEPSQQSAPQVSWDPNLPAPAMAAPPAASAPVFEDLLDDTQEEQKMPPSAYGMTPVAPPTVAPPAESSGGLDQEAIDAILGIEGLSDEEKAALIAEQEKIMQSIENEKKNSASPAGGAQARADAFEQRSHAAAVQAIGGGTTSSSSKAPRTVDLGGGQEVALHGQKKTFEAIKDGTAVLVQCLSCENWMQVTGNATMMFCPVCQTVSPVATQDEKEAASQMATDMELAEQLQKEEYKKAEQRQAKRTAAKAAATQQKQEESSSWMDWLGFGTPAPAPAQTGARPASPDRSFAQRPLERGEIGVSLPPGASRNNSALAMAPVYTGQEDDLDVNTAAGINLSRSHDSGDEDAALMGGGGGGATIAKQQPLFSCVADSISSAANSLYNATSVDGDGNVHGVDTSGLLAMPQAGRGNNPDYQKLDNSNSM